MLDFLTLNTIVANDAAIRRRQRLQPVGGRGDKIFPPTYPSERRNDPPQHVYEKRKVEGREVWCVLVDSVASQANRLEDALSAAIVESVTIPHLVVDFKDANLAGLTEITSLQAPHRIYDAIFRDSSLDGQPFMSSGLGTRLAQAKPECAAALLEVAPTALLFGSWHSTGQGGGLGAKFARCLVSEIMAIDVPVEEVRDPIDGGLRPRTSGRRVGSRIDPLGILKQVPIYKNGADWDTTNENLSKAKLKRPSEINHGNIAPSIQPLGITCDHLEHMVVLSCAGLRRLRFGNAEQDRAGRTLLAALGLLAVCEQDARGYALRSRCDLVCEEKAPFEIVKPDGSSEVLEIDRDAARELYAATYQKAKETGLELSDQPIRLTPQRKLVEIVRKSQELALSGRGSEEGDQED